MNRIILSLLFLLLGLTGVQAQQRKFSVASFENDPFDLTAKNDQHKKIDGNGSLTITSAITLTPLTGAAEWHEVGLLTSDSPRCRM